MKSGAGWLASATPDVVDEFLHGLTEGSFLALPWVFEFWALPHQLPPEGAWKSWVVMGGRGAGKTRAGAEWVRARAEADREVDEELAHFLEESAADLESRGLAPSAARRAAARSAGDLGQSSKPLA